LRKHKLWAEREAQLWEELSSAAIFYTTHLEGNELTFDEAKAVIEEHRRRKGDVKADG